MKPMLILFVHGLGATSESTWRDFRRLVAEDAQLGPIADVAFFGFKTAKARWSLFPSSRMQKVADLSEGLRTEIEERYRDYDSIVLAGHSMGGLVIRRYLVDEVRRSAPLRVTKVLLFAVPNQGSEVAAVAQLFSIVHAQLGDLSPDSTFLETLNRDWLAFEIDKRVDITYVVAGLDEAVRKQSAVGFWGDAKVRVVTDKSHSELVAVADKSDLAFLILRNAVLDSTPAPHRAAPAPPQMAVASPRPSSAPPAGVTYQLQPTTQTGLPPAPFANQLSMILVGQSPAGLIEAAEAKPRLDELFEVISDPAEVARALFQTDEAPGLAPYDVEYVNAREGVPDIQESLETALRATRGRLLVCGLRGIGKTREIAELARAACATKWKVLVARTDGNARMGPVLELPRALTDARLLLVVDNLHNRMLADADPAAAPYLERLERLLTSLERQLPGGVRVLATARDEPRFQPNLQLPRDEGPWHGFGVFRLPKFTDAGLRQMLTKLAAAAGVSLEAGDAEKFVENSDHKPETIFINVDLARQKRAALTHASWKPTEGESWQLRFVSARAEQAGVDRVCQALHLVVKAGVPPRVPYVTSLALAAGEPRPDAAVDLLVGEGLLRLRQGVLAPFSPEQLEELVGRSGSAALAIEESAPVLERAIVDPPDRHKEWMDDLLALALALARSQSKDRAEAVVTRAIALDPAGSRAYRIRSGIRFGRADFTGAEADLSRALEMGDQDADTYFMRACIRNLLANHAAALDDLDRAAAHGRDDAAVQAQRGSAFYQLARWPEADAAMTAAIERGDATGGLFFTRGIIRLQLNDAAGAERDLSAALAAGTDLNEVAHQILELEPGAAAKASGPPAGGSESSSALTHALRGWMRLRLGRNQDAEEDLTIAIDKGAADGFRTIADAMQASSLPLVAQARTQLNALKLPFGEGLFFHLRGLAQLNLEKFAEAAADFDQAIAREFIDGEVYFARGCAYLRMERFADAAEDATSALASGKTDVLTYVLRGTTRLALQRFAEAEQDFDAAVALDADNAQFYTWRGVARMQQHKLEAADSDLTVSLDRRADAATVFQRGCVRFDLGRYSQAEADLTAAVDLGFTPATLFVLRGMARLIQDKLVEADADATDAFAGGASDFLAYSLRAAVRLTQGRHDEAEADLTAAIGVGRNDEWVFTSRGRARYELERYAEAEQDFSAAIALGATDPGLFVERGRARLAQNKGAEAEEDIKKAIDAGRDSGFVHFCLARAQQQQEQWETAETELDLALLREDRTEFRSLRGHLRLIRANLRAAEEDLDLVIAAEPANVFALYLRGAARYARLGFEDALADYNAALALGPDEASLVGARALVHIRLDALGAAEADCQHLDAIEHDGPEAQGCRGVLHLAHGRLDDALPVLRTAAERDTSWLSWQGLVCLLVGKIEESRQAYQQVAAANVPFGNLQALIELDAHLPRHPERAAAEDVRSAVEFIRSVLGERPSAADMRELT